MSSTCYNKAIFGKELIGIFDIIKAGEQISLLRKAKGMTQEALAEKLGISPQAISKWENGHTMPEASMLVDLSNILGCSVDSILIPENTESLSAKQRYTHMLLPYRDVAAYSGAWWPRRED